MGTGASCRLSLPSDNATIREMYLHQRMSDCHLELLAVCQEGELTLKSLAVDIDDGELPTPSEEISCIDMT